MLPTDSASPMRKKRGRSGKVKNMATRGDKLLTDLVDVMMRYVAAAPRPLQRAALVEALAVAKATIAATQAFSCAEDPAAVIESNAMAGELVEELKLTLASRLSSGGLVN